MSISCRTDLLFCYVDISACRFAQQKCNPTNGSDNAGKSLHDQVALCQNMVEAPRCYDLNWVVPKRIRLVGQTNVQ